MTGTRIHARYITTLDQIPALSADEKDELRPVVEQFAFRTNDYYQSLIDWNDPDDPIRRIVMPDVQELDAFGEMDASHEAGYTVLKGLEHKYDDTGLLLVNNVCGAYCRFCFRKRLFTEENDEVTNDITGAVEYIREHPKITNVLLSGGDPLIMSTAKLEKIIQPLMAIDHVRIVRIGSKIPAFDPYRIVNDPTLPEMLSRYCRPEKRVYVMAHFNHPRELTEVAMTAMYNLQRAGATVVNQTPLIRGVNDRADVIAELFNRLSYNGIPPYYIFICRPTAGNKPFVVPVEECLEIFEQARRHVSGLAKRARLCMSHQTGKIEVMAKVGAFVVFKYHRAANPADRGRVLVFRSNPEACWLDDYTQTLPEDADLIEDGQTAPLAPAVV
jgi:KamA family protein